MNREIKFRAWDKEKNVFIPIDVWAVVTTDFNAFGIMIKDWENYKAGEYFYENSQELSQFTGLLDKNGKEIYEGDACDLYLDLGYDMGKFHFKGKVYFNENTLSYCIETQNKGFQPIFNDDCKFISIEIIGNIYETPELINQTA